MSNDEQRILDTSGLCCPMPVVKTNLEMKKMVSGESVKIIVTDVGAKKDLPSWCERTGNRLVSMTEEDGGVSFVIEKA
ncbi:MAG: sulfurtransferase TusA family protein [bacterium]|nr:sulfurtransferase TusA family protein [bacterium]